VSEYRRTTGPDTQIEQMWREDPMIAETLMRSSTVAEARYRLREYLEELEEVLQSGGFNLDRIAASIAIRAVAVFKNLLAPENEAIAGFSTLEVLWGLAHEQEDETELGFVDEISHLFAAMNGRSEMARGWFDDTEQDESFPRAGRRAAIERSRVLDQLAEHVWRAVASHPSGLNESIVEQRRQNREKILEFLGGTTADWRRPDWQFEHILKGETGAKLLAQLTPLRSSEMAAVRLAVKHGIPWGITPYYLSLFDFESSTRREDGQVRSQVIPPLHTVRRMVEHREDRVRAFDFMRERETSPEDRITRRYPTVAIFKVCDTCPQICAYCQRNWEISGVMMRDRMPEPEDLNPALEWFEAHPGITDILITGGDPLVLEDRVLAYLLERIASMDHVTSVRIGTRVPVTMPMRITEAFCELIGAHVSPGRRNISCVTHVESAYEVTPELAAAVDRLRRVGAQVYNQQVFTMETSRRFETVANRVALKRAGIDPYYTFYTKGKEEHRDYLVPIARILQERKEEARLLPGTYRTDEMVFNVPGLGKNHLRASQDRELIGIRADGRRVYLFHPWEKGIAAVRPWSYVDVSIRRYLEQLAELGEDPADYQSIWYYY